MLNGLHKYKISRLFLFIIIFLTNVNTCSKLSISISSGLSSSSNYSKQKVRFGTFCNTKIKVIEPSIYSAFKSISVKFSKEKKYLGNTDDYKKILYRGKIASIYIFQKGADEPAEGIAMFSKSVLQNGIEKSSSVNTQSFSVGSPFQGKLFNSRTSITTNITAEIPSGIIDTLDSNADYNDLEYSRSKVCFRLHLSIIVSKRKIENFISPSFYKSKCKIIPINSYIKSIEDININSTEIHSLNRVEYYDLSFSISIEPYLVTELADIGIKFGVCISPSIYQSIVHIDKIKLSFLNPEIKSKDKYNQIKILKSHVEYSDPQTETKEIKYRKQAEISVSGYILFKASDQIKIFGFHKTSFPVTYITAKNSPSNILDSLSISVGIGVNIDIL